MVRAWLGRRGGCGQLVDCFGLRISSTEAMVSRRCLGSGETGAAMTEERTDQAGRLDEIVVILVNQLPQLPVPWSVEELCKRVAEQRRRPLHLHAVDVPALPFGLWFDDGKEDHILYRVGCTGYHRDHIVLHELCHMLAGHNAIHLPTDNGEIARPDLVHDFIERTTTNSITDFQEEAAETFATRVLKRVEQTPLRPPSEFERRASKLFGHG